MEVSRKVASLISVVYVTVPTLEFGKKLAREIIDEKLAACVNVVPQITSIYKWKDNIEEADEILLIIKTTSEAVPRLKDAVIKKHTYDVPEFVVLPVEQGHEPYMKWVEEQVSKKSNLVNETV